MRIDKNRTYAGVPALALREGLRPLRNTVWTSSALARRLRMPEGNIAALISELETEGLIEHSRHQHPDYTTWVTTTKGNALAMASAAPRSLRKTGAGGFSTFLDYNQWPQIEVRNFLKARSRGLSLHLDEKLDQLTRDYRVLYSGETDSL